MSQTEQFNPLSLQLTCSLTKAVKKSQGIYFTPKSIVNHLLGMVLPLLSDLETFTVLEPSCGSCEFVQAIDSLIDNISITCVELNETIYQEITKIPFKNQVQLLNTDFIHLNDGNTYDLIIGNPPYFVCKRDIVPEIYDKFITGRPNMFGLFIIHSLSKLNTNGILAFVIPKSFLNSVYYASIRNYIKQTCDIIKIHDYTNTNDFIDTEQSTFGLIIRKTGNIREISDCQYSIKINGNYIFTPSAEILQTYFNDSTTLKQLGLSVKTGTIVWNEKKDILTDDERYTILLYNTNVTNDNKLKLTKFKNDEKGQYIKMNGSTEPVIVVNRGNGNAKYNFKYALIEKLRPFVVENHLNVIYDLEERPKTKLIELYKKIIHSFENPKTREFIDLFFGNNGLSKTELETILPIYL